MKIDDFANGLLDSYGAGKSFYPNNKSSAFLYEAGQNSNAQPLLITSTWQALLESPDLAKKLYPNALGKASVFPFLNRNLEKYLLCLGNNNYCLLIFDPAFTSDEPVYIDASKHNSFKSVRTGYSIWKSKIDRIFPFDSSTFDRNVQFTLGNSSNKSTFDLLNADVFSQNISDSDWPVIITKPPKRDYTTSYPTKPHKMFLQNDNRFRSLAGTYTTNKEGVFGCTICLHCFPNSYVEVGKTKVVINGISGTVISTHNVSDSCFVQLDADISEISDLLKSNGPLQGTTPREFEQCTFVNKESQQSNTNVIGWSPDILYNDPYNQVKVITNPITNPGDSGSALLDMNGNILGFSFYRTEINAVKEFSAWMWATSVFKAHDLKYK
ncbi:MAG: hypothetical protein PSV16_11585 [Flavobacterium sp.]|nr:hypothetical protein [Flavobacterium sp.]